MSTYKLSTDTVDNLNDIIGIKGYDSTASYSLNDVVINVYNNEIKLYQSLSDNNTSSLSDTTKWKEVKRRQSVMSIPATSGTVMLADNTIYNGTMTGAMTFALPTVTDATQYHQIKAMLYLPVVTINWGTTHYIGGEAPSISNAGQYMIYWDYVPALSAWAVGCMKVV